MSIYYHAEFVCTCLCVCVYICVSEEEQCASGHVGEVAGGNSNSSYQKLFDGPILDRQGPETTDAVMSFVSSVPLHVCCCDLSLVFGMV